MSTMAGMQNASIRLENFVRIQKLSQIQTKSLDGIRSGRK